MPPRIVRHRWDDIPLDKVTEMVARKTLGGDDLQLTQAYFKKGTKVPVHAHAGETLLYVLQGVVRVVTGPDDVTLREGDLLVVPAGTSHQAEVFDDAFVMVVGRAGVKDLTVL
ncbi:MAG: cupin domain-containing protein [Acidobacteria bacterium]|nr:cupin domain-containing protein [Acidobacteriota bacterium]